MTVKNLYKEQFEELREKLEFAYDDESLEAVGAITEDWNYDDIQNWIDNNITDELVIKSFEIYSFSCDDFWSTAGKYDEYPDKEETT